MLPGVAGCRPGSSSPIAREKPPRTPDSVTRQCLKRIVADIGALKGRHPELADWREDLVEDNFLCYLHNCVPAPPAKREQEDEDQYGANGCWIAVHVLNAPCQLAPEYTFMELSLFVHVMVGVGKDGDKAFAAEVRAIIDRNLAPLEELEREAGGYTVRSRR
jgi:hypothetical protein